MLRCGGQVRVGPAGGVIGLDFAAVMALGSGIDPAALSLYLPYCEAGMLAGYRRRNDGHNPA